MRVDFAGDKTAGSKLLWVTSITFAAIVLVGHSFLEDHRFSVVLVLLALLNSYSVLRHRPPLSSDLLTSQGVVVLASITSVILHVVGLFGFESEFLVTLGGFARASLLSAETCLFFGLYLLIRLVCFFGLYALLGRLLRKHLGIDRFFALLYAASAVNVACEYSIYQPLYRVNAGPDALAFLFSAGIFGLEFSLPLYLLVLVITVGYRYRLSRLNSPW